MPNETPTKLPRTFALKSQLETAVYYEDTDFSGSVYHAQYLKFFERAREELLTQDLLLKFISEFSLQFVVREVKIKYLKAAKFADKLIIESKVLVSPSPTMIFFQNAYLKPTAQNQDMILLTEAEIMVVAINKEFKPRRLNPEVLALLLGRT